MKYRTKENLSLLVITITIIAVSIGLGLLLDWGIGRSPDTYDCVEYSDTSRQCLKSRTRSCARRGCSDDYLCGPWGPVWVIPHEILEEN
jgi:hypothetical protein